MPRGRLLLIEDEGLVRQPIARALARAGYVVDEVESAEEGLARIRRTPYDLMLMDIGLPSMDGLELLKEAQSIDHQAGALIITGYTSLANAVQAMELGAMGLLAKPLYPDQVLTAVRDALERRWQAREASRLRAYQPMMELSRLVGRGDDLPQLIESFLRVLAMYTEAGRIALFLRLGDRLVLAGSRGFRGPLPSPAEDAIYRLEAGLGDLEGDVGYFTWPGLRPASDDGAVALCVPLQMMGRVLGLAALVHRRDYRAFSRGDVELLWATCALMVGVVASAEADVLHLFLREASSSPVSGQGQRRGPGRGLPAS